jgi:hypothetical protein
VVGAKNFFANKTFKVMNKMRKLKKILFQPPIACPERLCGIKIASIKEIENL